MQTPGGVAEPQGASATGEAAMLQTLGSYAPPPYLRLLATSDAIASPVRLPLYAAVLFADISGFTRLTERLCREGEMGVELLASTLNAYFGLVIDVIHEHGGEVVRFAGDGLIAVWSTESHTTPRADQSRLRSEQAACCALRVQAMLAEVQPVYGISMVMRIGIGIGAGILRQLGGWNGRWEFVYTGPALRQASLACPQAEPGGVVLAPEILPWLTPRAQVDPLPQGWARLRDLTGIPPLDPRPAPLLQPTMLPALRTCLPDAILDRIDAGQSGWLTELRRVTVLFMRLPSLDGPETEPDSAQGLIRAMQAVIGRYEGCINKLHVDEKGTMLLAVFGLPPLSHPDDALRGLRTALQCQAVMKQRGEPCAIGVATGHAFCGTVGNGTHREYTVLGDVVNLAARLMIAGRSAPGEPSILSDAATHEAAKAGIYFGTAVSLAIKGKSAPVSTYPVLAEHEAKEPTTPPELQGQRLVGRERELQRIADCLGQQHTQPGGLIVIEGAAGIGKSSLSGQLLSQARQQGIRTLYGSGDAIERTTAYFAFTRVFREVFGLPAGGLADPSQARERLRELAIDPTDQLGLLGPILHLPLTDAAEASGDWATAMSSRGIAEQRQRLLIDILERLVDRGPLLLLLEDAHWLDSASWALLWRIRREVPRLLLVVASRPPVAIPDPAGQAEYQKLRAEPGALFIPLSPLSVDDTAALIGERLGVTVLPPLLIDFIYEQTHGHPFFASELVCALREAGALRLVDGVCQLTQTPTELRLQRFPTTMDGVVRSRIDRLRPQQLLALKVASVVGRTFVHRIVDGVHPIAADRVYLRSYLDDLEQQELTARHATIEPTYSFRHILIQEITYSTLSFAQRRELHLAVASWYERRSSEATHASYPPEEVTPLLAHHYGQAAEHPLATAVELRKAVAALVRAGNQALRSGAAREAVGLCERGLTLTSRLPDTPDRRQLELALRMPLSIGLGLLRGYAAAETEQALLQCLAQCRELGQPPELAPTLFGLWTCSLLRGRVWQARDYAEQMPSQPVQGTPSDVDSSATLVADLMQQATRVFLGEMRAARDYGEAVLSRYQRDRHQHLTYLYGVDLEVMSLVHQGHALWQGGDDHAALATYQRANHRASEVGHPYSMNFALYSLATYYQSHHDVAEVSQHAEALRRLADKHGYSHALLQAEFMRGWVLTQDGQVDAGLALMTRTVAARRASGAELSLAVLLTILAQTLLDCGRLADALAASHEALAQVAAHGERIAAAAALTVHAKILIRSSNGSFLEYPLNGAPDDLLLRALDIARSQGCGMHAIRAAITLCQLWGTQGNQQEARELLAATLAPYRHTLHKNDLGAALALLQELAR
ncbi:MAG TPA: AAA family ATPase [Pseudomonadota bacterium]|nr:AAA family ATPase [Pseudomonadota bacterium]